MLSTLTRHVLRETVHPFLLGLIVYTVVCVSQLLKRLAEVIMEGQVLVLGPALSMLVTALPAAFTLALPMALSMAILTGCGRLAADREILALRAAGHSPLAAFAPLLAVSGLASLGMLIAGQSFVPGCNLRSTDQALVIQFRSLSAIRPSRAFEFSAAGGSNAMISYDWRDEATGEMVNVVMSSRPPQEGRRTEGKGRIGGSPATIMTGARGKISADLEERMIQIVLTSGTLHQADRTTWATTRFATMTRGVRPLFSRTHTGQFRKTAREMTTRELWPLAVTPPKGQVPMKWSSMREIEATGERDDKPNYSYRLELLLRLSLPFACLAMALISFPLAMTVRPTGNIAGFAMSLVLIAAYYGMTKVAAAMTLNGLPAGPPAFLMPNLFMAVIGGVWLSRLSRQ